MLHYGDLDESPQGEVPFELLSDKSKMRYVHFILANVFYNTHSDCVRCQEADSPNFFNCLFSTFPSVPVSDIKSVLTGKDCPHMKEKSALKQNKVVTFSSSL